MQEKIEDPFGQVLIRRETTKSGINVVYIEQDSEMVMLTISSAQELINTLKQMLERKGIPSVT